MSLALSPADLITWARKTIENKPIGSLYTGRVEMAEDIIAAYEFGLRAPPASPTGRQLGPGKRDELPPIVSEGVGGFTPGPWRALPTPFEDRIEAVDHPGSCIASTGNWLVSEKSEQHANARLIAAAPDLLEALRWFIDDIDGTHTVMVEFDANVERARSALSKATGEGG